MPSKPHDPVARSHPPQSFHVSGLQTVMIGGQDAADFLQRQCMNDVHELAAERDGQWSGILSAKGRVLSLFRLYRTAEGYIACLNGGDSVALRDHLARLRFRSKVSFAEEHAALEAGFGDPPPDAVRWDADRWVRLTAATAPATASGCADEAYQCRWERLDWARGIPRIDATLHDRYTPQMLGLQRLRAFNLKKGCYPGQEIVARTHFLGQGKRSLLRVEAVATLTQGTLQDDDGRPLGEVMEVCRSAPSRGLAVVSVSAPPACFDAARQPVRLSPPDSGTTP